MNKNMKFRIKSWDHFYEIATKLLLCGYQKTIQYEKCTVLSNIHTVNGDILVEPSAAAFESIRSSECELINGVIRHVKWLAGYPTAQTTAHEPPIGLRPKCIVDSLRIQEILEAMTRYAANGDKIPVEWIEELADLNMEKA